MYLRISKKISLTLNFIKDKMFSEQDIMKRAEELDLWEQVLYIEYDCKMLAKSPKTRKNTQNIKNNYTKYGEIELDQTQDIDAHRFLKQS